MDATAVRRQAQRLLSIADLEPASMPQSAVLIVRHVDDPSPRGLMDRQDAILPAPSWVRAARSALADCFDRAARPIDGPVPPSANAVRFDDESQLLACLARDVLAGDAPARWWWRAFFRDTSRDALAAVVSAWLERPRAIPAAIAHLASGGTITSFIRALSTDQVRTLFVAVADAFDLTGLVAAANQPLPRIAQSRSTAAELVQPAGLPALDDAAAVPIEEERVLPPWQRVIDSVVVPRTLDIERQTLAGIALAIWRAPLAVRTRRFEQAFRAWRSAMQRGVDRNLARNVRATVLSRQQHIDAIRHDDAITPIEVALSRKDVTMPAGDAYAETAAIGAPDVEPTGLIGPDSAPVDRLSTRAVNQNAGRDEATRESTSHAAEEEDDRHAAESSDVRTVDGECIDRVNIAVPAFVDATLDLRPSVETPANQQNEEWIVTTPVTDVTTELGGILFLVNALDDERLWDRFAEAEDPRSPIGGWSWLALVARRLLGERADSQSDPIWRMFATLDGRDTVDVDAPPLLDVIVPPLRARLLSALEIAAESPDARGLLAERLFHRRAQLRWTATHVDLHMPMAQIDIAVRLAGLDANPGWVPALGRVVTFYFE